jgi:hypothetical protein
MIDIKETISQLVQTSLYGVVTKVLSIFLSNWLDNYMNHSFSNLIGLIVNASLDFFMMKHVFNVADKKSNNFIVRYTISIIVAVITAQLLYMGFHSYMVKYHNAWFEKNWKKYIFWIRYVVGAFAYGFVEFPLHKFWVFKNRV